MESTVEDLYQYVKDKYVAVMNRYLFLTLIPEKVAADLDLSPITIRKNLNRLASERRIHLEVRHGSNWIIWMDKEQLI